MDLQEYIRRILRMQGDLIDKARLALRAQEPLRQFSQLKKELQKLEDRLPKARLEPKIPSTGKQTGIIRDLTPLKKIEQEFTLKQFDPFSGAFEPSLRIPLEDSPARILKEGEDIQRADIEEHRDTEKEIKVSVKPQRAGKATRLRPIKRRKTITRIKKARLGKA